MEAKNKITLTNYLLEDIAYSMNQGDNYDSSAYLDLENNEVVITYSEIMDEEEIEEIDNDTERYIAIPQIYSSDKWEEMRDFIMNLDVDNTVRQLLLTNIQGSGAFGRFKDALAQVDKLDEWYEYTNRIDCEKVLDWLLDRDLIDKSGVNEGLRLHDETVAMRKQREKNISLMQVGSLIQCIDNKGHTGRITVGHQYKVVDEKPQHLMIRIRNDENKLKWYPKAHFELARKR